MNEELKPSRWRYATPILAALLVAGCVTYFNLALWEYPYFAIAWDRGWPLLCAQQSYASFGTNDPSFLSRDRIFYRALAANIAIGVVMTALAAWGVNHLQKINRSLFRIHLQTIMLLALATGTLMLLNSNVRDFNSDNLVEMRTYGWPHEAVALWKDLDQQGRLPTSWTNVFKNAFVALYALFLVTLFSESWLAWRARKTKS